MLITEGSARKVLQVVDHGLGRGLGRPILGEMCVEAAVCYALEMKHGDDPFCVMAALRELKIRLNDAFWSSPKDRAKGLRRLALAQLGSVNVLDNREFLMNVTTMTIQRVLPRMLRRAANHGSSNKILLEHAADDCESWTTGHVPSIQQAEAASQKIQQMVELAVSSSAFKHYIQAGVQSAFIAIVELTTALDPRKLPFTVIKSIIDTVEYSSRVDFAMYASANDSLAWFAEELVQILIRMQAPGCQWLYLTE